MQIWCFVAVVFAPLCASYESKFPDLSCLSMKELNFPKFKEINNECRKIAKRPTEKSCFRACLLDRFGFLTNPDPVKPTDDLQAAADTDLSIGSKFDGFVKLFKNAGQGEKLANNVKTKCVGKFQAIIDEKLPCDKWDGAHECVQKAVCPESVWPPLLCHDSIKPDLLKQIQVSCKKEAKLLVNRPCPKFCILEALGILEYTDEGTDREKIDMIDTLSPKTRGGSNRLLYEVASQNDYVFDTLKKKYDKDCESDLNAIVKTGDTCEKWDKLYNSVTVATEKACETLVQTPELKAALKSAWGPFSFER